LRQHHVDWLARTKFQFAAAEPSRLIEAITGSYRADARGVDSIVVMIAFASRSR
jgi:hypothetical protein